MPPYQRPWTPEEDEQLKKAFAERTPPPEIVKKIGRTEGGINNRAYVLRLKLGQLKKDGPPGLNAEGK